MGKRTSQREAVAALHSAGISEAKPYQPTKSGWKIWRYAGSLYHCTSTPYLKLDPTLVWQQIGQWEGWHVWRAKGS
jgi:hypothetical protein